MDFLPSMKWLIRAVFPIRRRPYITTNSNLSDLYNLSNTLNSLSLPINIATPPFLPFNYTSIPQVGQVWLTKVRLTNFIMVNTLLFY